MFMMRTVLSHPGKMSPVLRQLTPVSLPLRLSACLQEGKELSAPLVYISEAPDTDGQQDFPILLAQCIPHTLISLRCVGGAPIIIVRSKLIIFVRIAGAVVGDLHLTGIWGTVHVLVLPLFRDVAVIVLEVYRWSALTQAND